MLAAAGECRRCRTDGLMLSLQHDGSKWVGYHVQRRTRTRLVQSMSSQQSIAVGVFPRAGVHEAGEMAWSTVQRHWPDLLEGNFLEHSNIVKSPA